MQRPYWYEMNLEEEATAVKLYRVRGKGLSLYFKTSEEGKSGYSGTSLVVQWVGMGLAIQGTPV